ncbi:PIG-L family deacetylase [Castellaniella sp.]|uniref:PIG-L family deacetylase n=1 Tax=Castellaniella sp. TaxID=1955812 RepID=UPI002AFF8FB6|nr:PIG-L family deacetylase [Castellaniella sp.]
MHSLPSAPHPRKHRPGRRGLLPALILPLFLALIPPRAARAALPTAATAAPRATVQAAAQAPTDCAGGKVLSFVAHPDDDLLFMNPDQDDAIRQGRCVRTVYLTAGDRGEGLGYTLARERGIMAAYADMAGAADAWNTDGLTVGQHTLVRHTLRANPRIQLIMLRLPDPWLGAGWGSLTPLSRLESVPHARVRSYAPYPDTYTRGELVRLLADLIRQEHPRDVRLMDPSITIPYRSLCWRCAGHDHPDHIAGARLVEAAMALAPGPYSRTAYLNYPSQELQANLDAAQTARKTEIYLRYAEDDPLSCPPGADCSAPKGPEAAWVGRQYYAGPAAQPLQARAPQAKPQER